MSELILAGDVEAVRTRLLEIPNINLNFQDDDGNTAMLLAA